LAQYGQAVGIQNAMQQNQLGQMQMSAAQRAMQEEEGAKNFLSGNPDLSTPENQRRLLAFGKTGLAYGKAIAEQQKSKGEADKTAAEVLGLNQKNFTAINPPIRAAAGGIPGITAYVEAMYADPVLGALAARIKTKEQALKENIEMYTKDPDQWVTAHSNLEGAQMLEALKMGRENAAEKARVASLPPLPGAVPTGTVNDARAALVAPGAAPNFVTGVDSFGKIGYAIDGAKVSKEEFDAAKNAYAAGVQTQPVRSFGQAEPINAMAAAAAAGNVNALAAPTGNEATLQAIAAESKKLRDRLDVLDRMRPSPGRDDEIKRREARLKEISAPINMRADGTTIIPGAGTLTAAPAPSDILRMQHEAAALRASGDIAGADAIDNRVKKLNELADNRTASQKEQAVLDDENATKTQKANATLQLAKLNHIPEKAMSDFERGLAASNLPEAEKNKLRNAWLKSHSEHAPPTQISLTQNAEKSYGTAFGGKIADLDVAKYDAASKAPELAANANRVLASLNDNNVFVGPAATIKLNLARVLNAAGASNDEKIANTETLISNLGRNTLGMVKSSGLGTGQGFTDKDLQFLERVAGGSIDYNAQTLRNLADLSHKAASASAESWGKRVKEIPASALGGTGISTETIIVPPRVTKAAATTRPAGVPAEWTLHTDANGKKAYVSPDGKSFKEVP
jgi:hypothetical protein